MQDLAKKFGNAVRAKRLCAGMSQDLLALMSDIDRSYIGRIERGEVNVTLEKVYCIAEALGCDIRDLLP